MAKKATDIGKNVSVVTEGDKLIITIDTTKSFGASASGKTLTVATTSGNKDVGDGLILGLNAYRYPDAKKSSKK